MLGVLRLDFSISQGNATFKEKGLLAVWRGQSARISGFEWIPYCWRTIILPQTTGALLEAGLYRGLAEQPVSVQVWKWLPSERGNRIHYVTGKMTEELPHLLGLQPPSEPPRVLSLLFLVAVIATDAQELCSPLGYTSADLWSHSDPKSRAESNPTCRAQQLLRTCLSCVMGLTCFDWLLQWPSSNIV